MVEFEGNPYFGATFAERKSAREAAEAKAAKSKTKAVEADEADDVENKSVAAKKTTTKRPARKS